MAYGGKEHCDVRRPIVGRRAARAAMKRLSQCAPRLTAAALALLLAPASSAAGGSADETQPDLIAAVIADDADRVAVLLAAGANVEEANDDGMTALHVAAALGRPDISSLLLAAGANVHAIVPHAAGTPLHFAASEGAREIAAALIEAGADIEAIDAVGHTPLHHVALRPYEGGEQGVAQLLIDAGANVDAREHHGYTALHMAVASNRHVLATALLNAGANIDASAAGVTPLHTAAAGGWQACVELLLNRGATPDPPPASGVASPLLLALENDQERAAAALVEHGADASVKSETGETAAAIAERKGMTAVLVRLWEVDETAPPVGDLDPQMQARLISRAIARDDPVAVLGLLEGMGAQAFTSAPLYEAAADGRLRVVRALLDAGFDANSGTVTPLHAAARNEHSEVAALLIERGADVDAAYEGWTPLHHALLVGPDRPAFATAHALIEKGADMHAATVLMGWTPLHLAANLSGAFVTWNYDAADGDDEWNVKELAHGPDVLQLVRTLIEKGADVNVRTRIGGRTPLRVAKESDERPGRRIEPGESSKAVLAALRAAGGRDEGCAGAPSLPVYSRGRPETSARWRERAAGGQPGCEYDLPFSVPRALNVGAWSVPGSFTAPNAEEALLFSDVGMLDGDNFFKVVGLRQQDGAVRPIMSFDWYTRYEGLCLDQDTNTHTAVFSRSYDGSCCGWVDTAYHHYDAEAGTLVEVFLEEGDDEEFGGVDEVCRWRALLQEREER